MFSLRVVSLQNCINTQIKPLNKRLIVFIPRLDNLFVMHCVDQLNLSTDFISWRWISLTDRLLVFFLLQISVLIKIGEVYFEGVLSETWPRPLRFLRQVVALSQSCKLLNIHVLFLNNFISWKHNEVFLVEQSRVSLD